MESFDPDMEEKVKNAVVNFRPAFSLSPLSTLVVYHKLYHL